MRYIKIAGTNHPIETFESEEDRLELGVDLSMDFGNVVQKAVESRRFNSTSRVGLLEASASYFTYTPELDDEALSRKLDALEAGTAAPVKVRTFLISWTSSVATQFDRVFAITPASLLKLSTSLDVSTLFLELMLEDIFWVKHGNGLFSHHDDTGALLKMEIFYRSRQGMAAGRSFIYTTYDFCKNVTTNICINFDAKSMPLLENLTKSSLDDPLALHCLILSQALDIWIIEGSKNRATLIRDENTKHDPNPKFTTLLLHRLCQQFHILLEDMNDLEDRIVLVQQANEILSKKASTPAAIIRGNKISYLLSKCRTTKRWISNYRDRTNIRINLAFHLSTQVDNGLNLQISKATTALAKDAQRDSSSMITIAAVTMFFLPGTFISAVFSMTFFNFEEDDAGHQQFQVSERWWYFLAATIPLTAVVFVVWILWQKIRFRKFKEEDVKAKLREERRETPAFGHDDNRWSVESLDDDSLEIPVRPQEKQHQRGILFEFLKRRKAQKDSVQVLA